MQGVGQGKFAICLGVAVMPSVGQWQVRMPQGALKEAPYVGMTQHMARQFEGRTKATYQVEPDSSSGSYFWAMDHLVHSVQAGQANHIQVASWPSSEWQIDTRFPKSITASFHTFA